MRLIDANKLLHQGYDYVVDGIAYDSCNKSMDIEDIPTVQAIPLDKVKQAREEINQAYEEFAVYDPFTQCGYSNRVDEILNKLIAESE